jgi:hypothetical protein
MTTPTKPLLAKLERDYLYLIIEVGLRSAVRAYYIADPDATHLDDEFHQGIEAIVRATNLDAETLITTVEEEINFDGGILGSNGIRHGVATYGRGD